MGQEMVEREALLFEAGDYPDKGLTVTEADLDRMAEAFGDPAPIQVEHTEGPLRFGWLVRVWRKGSSLFGKLVFKPSAWELVKESGAKALSIGLNRKTLAIQEVSLVRKGRVASAQVFSEDALAYFHTGLPGEADVSEQQAAVDGKEDESDLAGECQQLRVKMAERDARDEMDLFKRTGKIAPAAEDAALALLSCRAAETVQFGEHTATPADAFKRFLEAQPTVVLFGELAAAGKSKPSPFGEADRRVFGMLGVSDEDVEKTKDKEENRQVWER